MKTVSIFITIANVSKFCLFPTVPSGPPVNLVVQNTSANSLSVSWERPSEIDINGIRIRYDIDYAMESDDELQTVAVPEDTLTAMLVDLDNYTVYRVSVYAVTIDRGPPANQTERTSENGEFTISNEAIQ